ncbi:MAG: lysine exporter LysO family protein [Muribaculaceae bacterium]|nr:lysine exporter LysO family protein [Muribaculaceae bacterium]
MFIIIIIMAAGITLGWLLRGKKLPFLGKLTNVLIWVLLFLLGVEVGGDDRIINGIATLGAEAAAVAVAGVAGSCLLAAALWKWASRRRKEGAGK